MSGSYPCSLNSPRSACQPSIALKRQASRRQASSRRQISTGMSCDPPTIPACTAVLCRTMEDSDAWAWHRLHTDWVGRDKYLIKNAWEERSYTFSTWVAQLQQDRAKRIKHPSKYTSSSRLPSLLTGSTGGDSNGTWTDVVSNTIMSQVWWWWWWWWCVAFYDDTL
jgi:hypothetical protein